MTSKMGLFIVQIILCILLILSAVFKNSLSGYGIIKLVLYVLVIISFVIPALRDIKKS